LNYNRQAAIANVSEWLVDPGCSPQIRESKPPWKLGRAYHRQTLNEIDGLLLATFQFVLAFR
jgi:hypothetical protein